MAQHTYTLRFRDCLLEEHFQKWYKQERLIKVDTWYIYIDVGLHLAGLFGDPDVRQSAPALLLSLPFAFMHLYLLLRRKPFTIKFRRPIIIVRRLLVSLMCATSKIGIGEPCSPLRDLFGSTGVAHLLFLQCFRDTWVLTGIYNLTATAMFIGMGRAQAVCAAYQSSAFNISLVKSLVSSMDVIVAVVSLNPTYAVRHRAMSAVVWQTYCKSMVRTLQLVAGCYLTTLIVYVLEQRARKSFVGDVLQDEGRGERNLPDTQLEKLLQQDVLGDALHMAVTQIGLVVAFCWTISCVFHGL